MQDGHMARRESRHGMPARVAEREDSLLRDVDPPTCRDELDLRAATERAAAHRHVSNDDDAEHCAGRTLKLPTSLAQIGAGARSRCREKCCAENGSDHEARIVACRKAS